MRQKISSLISALIIVGSIITLAVISQIIWAYDHGNFKNLALRIVLALVAGTLLGTLYAFIVCKIVRYFAGLDIDKILRNMSRIHIPIYLLLLFVLFTKFEFIRNCSVYVTILTLILLGLVFRLLKKEQIEISGGNSIVNLLQYLLKYENLKCIIYAIVAGISLGLILWGFRSRVNTFFS